jgi:hypothetical protein
MIRQEAIAFGEKQVELFHTPHGEAFATVPLNPGRATWLLQGSDFRGWLTRQFYEEEGVLLRRSDLQEVIRFLEYKALYEGPERTVWLRVAEAGEAIFIDLANDAWEAIEITARGWQVVTEPPVKFRRPPGMLALPSPVAGGCLEELQPLMNVATPQDWIVLLAWLVAALRPRGPYPVLLLYGEQGTGKSAVARLLRVILDPSSTPLRTEPRDSRNLMIAARHNWVLGFDNLSSLSPNMSDALCRLATGGGYAVRRLYTDADEALFDAQRPVLLTGIEELPIRGDLIDRALMLTLPPVSPA